MARQRLDQVDAMRPVKQLGVISTHSVLYFAPAAAWVGSGAALLLLHVSREGFFFISACMLTYAYVNLDRSGLGRFYWRRFLAVGIPYLAWNAVYFLWSLRDTTYTAGTALAHMVQLLATGYYQLYFLLVIMQFYVVFPLVLILLKKTAGHHGWVIAAAAAIQIAVSICMHWGVFPPFMIKYGQEWALSYVLYLIGGGVVAFHMQEAHDWVVRHARLVVFATFATAVLAEGVYFLSVDGITSVLGSGSDPFQPSVIPFNCCFIALGYLAGVALVRPWRSRQTKAAVKSGSDNAYGIYLSQMLFITFLSGLGWERLTRTIPWPLLCAITVIIVFACGYILTVLLARTPLAVPLTGRKRQPASTLIPRPRRAARPEAPGVTARSAEPVEEPGEPAVAPVAVAASRENGA